MKVEDIRNMVVIGFGTMGRQITQLFAQSGYSVVAMDTREEALQLGLRDIQEGRFGLKRAIERGKLTQAQAEKALASIRTTTNVDDACKEADFVVEAVFEDINLKKDTFRKLDKLCPENIVLATNTSTINITYIAAATEKPERVVGMHFFNPAQVMRLVEIIKGLLSSEETVDLTKNLSIKLGKTPIVVKDSPGFATSRLSLALFLEANKILEEGAATIWDIDTAMRLGYGYPMGPFELCDLVGLDARAKTLEAMYEMTGDPKWKPPLILRQLVSSGYLGDRRVKPRSKGGYYAFFKLPIPGEKKK